MHASSGRLRRSLGLSDAVVIGAGSMIGAGVYSAWSPASRSADRYLLIGLVVAASVAFLNAHSSARLAALYPESGGTYVYGRERLGDAWGFLAGWAFVVGKIASCAAMATTVGGYLAPDNPRPVAIGAVITITGVNVGGLRRTVAVTKVLLCTSAGILLLVVVSGWLGTSFDASRVFTASTTVRSSMEAVHATLQSAGLLFFAFAGYARIVTLGEEVRDPQRTIPRAIMISLAIVLVTYSIVGFTLLATLSPQGVASAADPLRHVVEAGPWHELSPLVRAGAAIAGLGALLNLIPGISRTVFAMARREDVPRFFSHVDSRRSLPVRAELAVAMLAILVIVVFDLRNAIALSGVGVLVYYAIANASASTLRTSKFDTTLAVSGVIGCLTLVACLPSDILVSGTIVLFIGATFRTLRIRFLSNR